MQLNSSQVFQKKQINQNNSKDINNDIAPSQKTIKQSKSTNEKVYNFRATSPINQIMQIKNIKNQQFLFRMKLKFISCMQQLQLSKQQIQALRKQQSDSDILTCFITPIKKQFASLKKLKDQLLVKERNGQPKSFQHLELISMSSQIQQYSQTEKKLKFKCQKLYSENAQLAEKLKKKQHEYQDTQNNLYKTRLFQKQYESVIQNLKSSAKKVQSKFIQEKQRLNQQIIKLKELMTRQRQAKQIYFSQLQNIKVALQQKECKIQTMNDQIDLIKKECLKWKNRAQWRQNESSRQDKVIQQKVRVLEDEMQKLNQALKVKETQVVLAKRQIANCSQIFSKKLQKIVEEWKAKLIQNVEEYQCTIQKNAEELAQVQSQNQRLKQTTQESIKLKEQNLSICKEIQIKSKTLNEIQSKLTQMEIQLKETSIFYTNKITELQSITSQLKSEIASKSLSIDQNINYRSQLQTKLNNQLKVVQILRNANNSKDKQISKIIQTKKQTEQALLKRISTLQNTSIIQLSKLKVESQQKINQKQIQISQLNNQINQLNNKMILIEEEKRQILLKVQFQQRKNTINDQYNRQFLSNSSVLTSSYQSVNNSLNTASPNEKTIDRANQFVDQSKEDPKRQSSIRRVFIRSNSINEYLNDYKKQTQQHSISFTRVQNGLILKKSIEEVQKQENENN